MRVVSLFSGAGGLDLGFVRAGHKVVWANDVDVESVQTYRENLGKHITLGDISLIPSSEMPECDIVIGGFPCQGFSVANTGRRADDARNSLYLQLLRVIQDKRPKFFLAENVKGITTLEGGKVFKGILSDFSSIGYRVKHQLLNAADFGVPQRRQRLFIVGVRDDIKFDFQFPSPTHAEDSKARLLGLESWLGIGKALSHIPEPEDAPEIPNHTYSKYKLRFNGYLGHREIDPKLPAPTVTARGDNKGGVVVLHHPNNHRRMSVRELAITQSFPIDFVFHCNQSSAYRLIGNAVPPVLAEAMAKAFPRTVIARVENDSKQGASSPRRIQMALGESCAD
jgi:DNA (cytosine-5)-methyltransferase 1